MRMLAYFVWLSLNLNSGYCYTKSCTQNPLCSASRTAVSSRATRNRMCHRTMTLLAPAVTRDDEMKREKKHTNDISFCWNFPAQRRNWYLHFNTHCIFWMKDIARWTIIYNKNLLQISSQLVQILHIVSTMIYTRFAEKPRPEYIPPKKQELRSENETSKHRSLTIIVCNKKRVDLLIE